ncbi:styrene monooxygenase/indole monooxygenase family protein [Nocardia blacklockiae]|uniref:styrene monooxygenase/indole monooxygenase family protein n=1 Tax=Nocardia blacklockiae TaxID=480036 RepID=UPI0018942748|nr:styrene monooxygenase/indole monooxygenase family protein [Nocardia blacklockiae]MBF6175749.1 FAD-binding oxidoreductase [Nocardia blacklockiae]
MTRIRILGAGECGLPLALRLLAGGAAVTVTAERDAEAILAGSVTSTQVKFAPTLELEAAAGLDFWQDTAPRIAGIRFTMVADGAVAVRWSGRFSGPARSVDQRTVFGRWLREFDAAGGQLELGRPTVAEIDRDTADYDLTVVTRASGELAACFPADPIPDLPTRPLRQLSALYLDGVTPDPDALGSYVALPGLGEVISYPGLTGRPGAERRCEMVLFEALPGGGLDVFEGVAGPAERLRVAKDLLARYLPPELADRYRAAELTDAGATLVGAVAPVLRQPVGTLPSGTPVLGGGDVVCRMDPGGAQGANNAAHCAARYAEAVLRRGAGPFDREWMTETAAPWLADIAHPAARWTATVLDPPAPMQELMLAAANDTRLADVFADTFARPATMTAFAAGA